MGLLLQVGLEVERQLAHTLHRGVAHAGVGGGEEGEDGRDGQLLERQHLTRLSDQRGWRRAGIPRRRTAEAIDWYSGSRMGPSLAPCTASASRVDGHQSDSHTLLAHRPPLWPPPPPSCCRGVAGGGQLQ